MLRRIAIKNFLFFGLLAMVAVALSACSAPMETAGVKTGAPADIVIGAQPLEPLTTVDLVAEAPACVKVGEMAPRLPIDYGRIPQYHLTGANAIQALIDTGYDTQYPITGTEEVVILFHAPKSAEEAAYDFRWVLVYVDGCLFTAAPFPGEVIRHILPGA